MSDMAPEDSRDAPSRSDSAGPPQNQTTDTTTESQSRRKGSSSKEVKSEDSSEAQGIKEEGGTNSQHNLPGDHDATESEVAPKKEESPDSDSSIPKFRPKSVKPNIRLFLDLPSATEEAKKTYETLLACTYGNKTIGNSGQDEAMTCDCKPHFGKLFHITPVAKILTC